MNTVVMQMDGQNVKMTDAPKLLGSSGHKVDFSKARR